jgi:hypothetical protein
MYRKALLQVEVETGVVAAMAVAAMAVTAMAGVAVDKERTCP